ncbi:MAG: tetratricopeptide repeat protein [Bacteroidales bacterium]|nr:tetratricopeptide repeat protein [Bacteroidales bacterium]
MHKLILLLLVIGANSIVSVPAFAQNDSISTYDGWITASFDALDEDNNQLAEQCLKNAMRLEPANPQNGLLFVNLGTIQRRLGKLQDAEVSYTCAISLLEENTVAYSTRASLYAEIEQYQKAIDDYSVVISRNPEDEDALYERALCRLMNSDTIGARLDLETIDKFNPKSAKSRLGMAMVYKAMGENAMAVELYDALIKANPKSWSLLRDRAEVYFFSKRLGAAMLDIDKSIQMNGRDPLSYFLRAKIRWAKGDREYARRDLNRAIELGLPQSAAADLIEKMK